MTQKTMIFLFVATSAAIAAVFLVWPEIDLAVAGWFFDPERKFYLGENVFFLALHNSVRYLTIGLILLWMGLLAVKFLSSNALPGISRRTLIYLLLALAIGPGLVVNTIFKDQWGRARPHQIEQFGGAKHFTPPFIMTDQCERNCSFVSGDPSVGFYFFALALAFPKRRRQFSALALALGGTFGVARIVMGAHFLSDVIFSGVFTTAVCYGLYWAMFQRPRCKA